MSGRWPWRKEEEAALPAEGWEVAWCTGVPAPHVLSSDRCTLLIFLVNEPDPDWDGSFPELVDPRSAETRSVALVEFRSCYEHKFGGPNDEVFEGLRWEGKGLEPYSAHVIANSVWVKEAMRINSVHRMYDSASWADLKHYVLLFHDNMFECLAKGFSIEVMSKSVPEVVKIAADRLLTD